METIADYIFRGAGKHQTFDRLARLGDKFGPRMVGSDALDQVIGESIDSARFVSKLNTGASKGVHGDAKCVKEILWGQKIRKLGSKIYLLNSQTKQKPAN